MGKISVKKRLENEIKHVEDRLSSLNNSLKTLKSSKKEQEIKHVDDIIRSTGLSTALATKIYEEKKVLAFSNRVEELSLKLVDLKTKRNEINEKEKHLDKVRATYYLLPLYNQIINLKNVITTVRSDIEKAEKEVKKLEKQLNDKKQVKDAAENNYLKVSKEVNRGLDKLDNISSKFNKTNEQVKDLEKLMKDKEKTIDEIQNKEGEKLDLLFVIENSRALKDQLLNEKDSITISKEQIDNINKINDIEIEVKLLEEKKKEINRQAKDTKEQMEGIKSDIDDTTNKLQDLEELQRSLLPSIGDSNDNLYTLISRTNDELNSLTMKLSEIKVKSEERDRLLNINESYVFEIEELNKKIKLNKENETKQKEIIKEIKKEIEDVKKEGDNPSIKKVIKELTTCIDKSNKIIERSKEERLTFKNKADEKSRLLSINYAEIKLLNNKISEFNKEYGFKANDDAVSKIETDREIIKLLKSAIDDYYSYDLQKKELEQDINESYALHHILSVRVSELNTESENISFKIKSLREEYQDFIDALDGTTINELRSEFNENIIHSEELSKKIEGQAVLSLECNEKLSNIESVIAQKKLSLASIEDRIENLSKEIASVTEEANKLAPNSIGDAKDKLNDKLAKATTAKLKKDEEYNALKDQYDALLVLINSKNEAVTKYNEQVTLFTDKLENGLKQYSIKSQNELKSIALPKREIERIEKQILDYYTEIRELEREKQVYLNMIAGKALDPTVVKKDEDALKNVDSSIKKSINAYKNAANKNIEAKYQAKNAANIRKEIEVLTEHLSNLKEIKKLLEKDN